jgi:hypothetical protein
MGQTKTLLDNYSRTDNTQIYIIRQSQVQRSLEYFQLLGIQPTPLELLRTAELFKEYVLHGNTIDLTQRCTALQNYITEKYPKE